MVFGKVRYLKAKMTSQKMKRLKFRNLQPVFMTQCKC